MLALKICILISLFSICHGQTYPNVKIFGEILANHSFVNLSLVGNKESDSVQCHTDLNTCCSSTQGIHRGNWYFPNGTRLLFIGEDDIYEHRDAQKVCLRRKADSDGPTGVYRCQIQTIAVRNSMNFLGQSIYVGFYLSYGG